MTARLDEALIGDLRRVAQDAAEAARAASLARFRAPDLATEDKGAEGRFDPVTEADRATEAAIRAVIARARPEDGVLGEEDGALPSRSGLTWVIDPIDGTRAFMSGAPSWGVLIALNDGTRPALGVIDQPFTGERFEGLSLPGRREAVWRRGAESRPLRVRPCADLAAATLFTTFPEIGSEAERAAFARVRDRVRLTRYGLDCYAYALLAMGCVDLVIEAGLAAYDVQALIPVIEGAGGVITGWDGGDCQHGGRVLAAGDARTHAQARALLADARGA